jgi:Tfp pilus assembly protein PilN
LRAVNLLPREEPRRQGKRFTVGVQLALVSPFVVLSLLAAGYLQASSKVHDNKATLQALQDELAALPAPAAEPQANGDLALQRGLRIAALSAALEGRLAWDRILREISTVLPEDVWLTTIKAESPQTPTAPPPPPPTTTTTAPSNTDSTATTTTPAPAPPATAPLSLEGYTYSQEGVARLLTRLAVIPELQDVKLVKSSQAPVAGQIVVSFSIQAGVRRQAAA